MMSLDGALPVAALAGQPTAYPATIRPPMIGTWKGKMMAKATKTKPRVDLEDAMLAQSFELDALLNVLESKGVLSKDDVLEEIKRLMVEAVREQ